MIKSSSFAFQCSIYVKLMHISVGCGREVHDHAIIAYHFEPHCEASRMSNDLVP